MLKVSLGYFQRRPNNKANDEVWSVTIRLASLPKSAMDKYHPDQLALYSKFSELMFKALNLPSVIKFMEGLAEALGLEYVEVLVNR